MNASAADKRIIANWLTRLMGVTRQSAENPIDPETLADYTEMLALDFPTGAFTAASLRAVATGSEWFPAYDRIRRELRDWWNAHRPSVAPQIAGPKDDALSPEDQRALDSFRRRHDAAVQDPNKPSAPRGQALSLLRDRFPGAFRELMRDQENREAFEAWANQGNPSVRIAWNQRQIDAADSAEKARMMEIVRMREVDRDAAD